MQQTDPQPTPKTQPTEVREGLVARCRQAIEDGTYVTQDKLDVTAERLFRAVVGRSTAQG